jgi:hypothetical protein
MVSPFAMRPSMRSTAGFHAGYPGASVSRVQMLDGSAAIVVLVQNRFIR